MAPRRVHAPHHRRWVFTDMKKANTTRHLPSKAELDARHRARMARIAQSTKFPWMSVLGGLTTGVVIILFLGVNLISLFLVMGIVGIMSKGTISYFGTRP